MGLPSSHCVNTALYIACLMRKYKVCPIYTEICGYGLLFVPKNIAVISRSPVVTLARFTRNLAVILRSSIVEFAEFSQLVPIYMKFGGYGLHSVPKNMAINLQLRLHHLKVGR